MTWEAKKNQEESEVSPSRPHGGARGRQDGGVGEQRPPLVHAWGILEKSLHCLGFPNCDKGVSVSRVRGRCKEIFHSIVALWAQTQPRFSPSRQAAPPSQMVYVCGETNCELWAR